MLQSRVVENRSRTWRCVTMHSAAAISSTVNLSSRANAFSVESLISTEQSNKQLLKNAGNFFMVSFGVCWWSPHVNTRAADLVKSEQTETCMQLLLCLTATCTTYAHQLRLQL